MNKKHKEILISAGNTFASAFLLAILALPLDNLENIDKALLFSIVMTWVRAGIKAIQQYFVTRLTK